MTVSINLEVQYSWWSGVKVRPTPPGCSTEPGCFTHRSWAPCVYYWSTASTGRVTRLSEWKNTGKLWVMNTRWQYKSVTTQPSHLSIFKYHLSYWLLIVVFCVVRDLSTANLRFLSSRQALADLAHFRTVMAATQGLTNSKWVAFGGSYPGSLAAWFRLKYPHLVYASVATSAPVHATVNFPGKHCEDKAVNYSDLTWLKSTRRHNCFDSLS